MHKSDLDRELTVYRESLVPQGLANKVSYKKSRSGSLWQTYVRCSTKKARALLSVSVAKKLNVLPLSVLSDASVEKSLIVLFPSPLSKDLIKSVGIFLLSVELFLK